MCGRFTLRSPIEAISGRFNVSPNLLESLRPRYNIAPSEMCLTVVSAGGNISPESMEWGFIGKSQKSERSFRLINSRADKLISIPRFLTSLQYRRCLVVADGFYEWQKNASKEGPTYYQLQDSSPFAFAGIWAYGLAPSGSKVKRFSIITTEANSLVGQTHDRMPAILSEESEGLWLDQSRQNYLGLLSMLIPFPSGSMKGYKVSNVVNRSGIDDKKAVNPITK